MLAVLSTLAFVATLWLVGMVAFRMIEENGGKIIAALKGQSPLAFSQFTPVAVRVRMRGATQQRPVRVQPRQRAAA